MWSDHLTPLVGCMTIKGSLVKGYLLHTYIVENIRNRKSPVHAQVFCSQSHAVQPQCHVIRYSDSDRKYPAPGTSTELAVHGPKVVATHSKPYVLSNY